MRVESKKLWALMIGVGLIASCGSDPSPSAGAPAQAATAPPPSAAGNGTPPSAASASGSIANAPSQASAAGAGAAAPSVTAGRSGSSAPSAGGAGASAGAPAAISGGAGAAGNASVATKTMVYWLDILGNAVYRADADGSNATAFIKGNGISAPDGIQVDLDDKHIYWTNMGSALGGANTGTVQRAALDGSQVETLVPAGVGNTFKQMAIDRVHHKLYWCDREGAKLWRSDLDGKNHEVLASGHGFDQLVGIALDVDKSQLYFTDRNAKKIMRAGLDIPSGQTDANRTDIELLFTFGGNSMPIDLDLDLDQRLMYWTDRGLGTVQRAKMDMPSGADATTRKDEEKLISNVGEPIGISLDLRAGKLYFGNVAGQLQQANLDGSQLKMIARSSSVTGVTVVYLPE